MSKRTASMPKSTERVYLSLIRPAIEKAEAIAVMMREQVQPGHLVEALVLLSKSGSSSTSTKRLVALRSLAHKELPTSQLPKWISHQNFDELSASLKPTLSEISKATMQKLSLRCTAKGIDISSILELCAPPAQDDEEDERSTKQKRKETTITLEMIEAIEAKFHGDRQSWIYESKMRYKSSKTPIIALRPTFLTGIRPREIWSARLLLPLTSAHPVELIKQRSDTDLCQAVQDGLYYDIEDIVGDDEEVGMKALSTLLSLPETKLVPPVFVVYTRKQGNAPKEMRVPFRAVRLTNISEEDLHAIYGVTQFRWMLKRREPECRTLSARELTRTKLSFDFKAGEEPYDDKRMAYETSALTVLLGKSLSNLRLDLPEFTFVTLRHSFATRTRQQLPLAQATVLQGNSSPRTTRGYGKKNIKWKKKSGSTGGAGSWLPSPDPARVQVMEARMAEEIGLEAVASQHDDSEAYLHL